MPRFVLLRHQCPPTFEKPSHWDFMLEANGVLRTWELRELPSAWAALLGEVSESETVAALPLPDHRLAYLDYEGPVSGDRGSVRCVDRGTYEPFQATLGQEPQQAFAARIQGKLLRGTIRLTRQAEAWLLAVNVP